MHQQAVFSAVVFLVFSSSIASAQRSGEAPPAGTNSAAYQLGPGDQLNIRVLDLEEVNDKNGKPVRVDTRGNISIPVAGRVHAEGLTVEQVEAEIAKNLSSVLQDPEVTVSVAEFRSQPVSVLGSVKTPGVQQVQGKKTLFEVVSLAGGLNADAGNIINITRAKEAGPLPLPNAMEDSTGLYRTASVNVKSVMDAKNPQENIEVMPNDVISVPKGDLVYVIGAVHKAGGFVLSEKDRISVLQALSLAEGMVEKDAAPKAAKILRQTPNSTSRTEIPVNLKDILAGKATDLPLMADDILFVPTGVARSAGLRSLEIAVQVASGLAIYRLP